MKELLISILEQINPNVFLQGTLNPEEAYPDSFITFFTSSTYDDSFYDDEVNSTVWSFSVIYYSSDPATIESTAAEIRTRLKAAGFIPQGKGQDIPSDVPTHTGWALDFLFRENN